MGRRNKILIIAMLVMLVVVVPLTIIQSLNQQITKQRASNDYVVLEASSGSSSYDVGSSFDTNISLANTSPDKKDISAIDITINYDENVLKLVKSDTESNYDFDTVLKDIQTPGQIHFIGIRTDTSPEVLSLFRIGALTFEAINPSNGTSVSFSNVIINASEHTGSLSFTPQSQSYVITKASSSIPTSVSVPTSIPTLVPTSTPIPTMTPVPTETPVPTNTPAPAVSTYTAPIQSSESCRDTFGNANIGMCTSPSNGNRSCLFPTCDSNSYACGYQPSAALQGASCGCRSTDVINGVPTCDLGQSGRCGADGYCYR